jgi:hypothetical protein
MYRTAQQSVVPKPNFRRRFVAASPNNKLVDDERRAQEEHSAKQRKYDNQQDRAAFGNGQRNVEQSIAEQNGLRDGRTDGAFERRHGRRFRAGQTNNHRSAMRGYSYGDRNQYKAM